MTAKQKISVLVPVVLTLIVSAVVAAAAVSTRSKGFSSTA